MNRRTDSALATLTAQVSHLHESVMSLSSAVESGARAASEDTAGIRADITRLERQITEQRVESTERFATKAALDRVEERRASEIDHLGQQLGSALNELATKQDERFSRVFDRLDHLEDDKERRDGAKGAVRGLWGVTIGASGLVATMIVVLDRLLAAS